MAALRFMAQRLRNLAAWLIARDENPINLRQLLRGITIIAAFELNMDGSSAVGFSHGVCVLSGNPPMLR
jgi:hypothetical protein